MRGEIKHKLDCYWSFCTDYGWRLSTLCAQQRLLCRTSHLSCIQMRTLWKILWQYWDAIGESSGKPTQSTYYFVAMFDAKITPFCRDWRRLESRLWKTANGRNKNVTLILFAVTVGRLPLISESERFRENHSSLPSYTLRNVNLDLTLPFAVNMFLNLSSISKVKRCLRWASKVADLTYLHSLQGIWLLGQLDIHF